ncbi:ParA family protein [Micrococcus luteus]|uniref:ParA family protein n=1 Tax=Micrococcus luteus TaxID=1270 RepID=UPI0022B348AD|nr:ParA family protein [Micrococcus luteus]MCZ6938945.1 ParA family protein [Micrococcus luteus]
MHSLMIYSEAGGVAKTTTAVSLATSWAEQGHRVVLIDLDPRAAATKWLDVQPVEEGLHVGAVIGNTDPTGWIADLAVPSGWHENLRVVPSDRSLSHQESERADHAHLRLRMALTDLDADLVVIDCPNRQGGPLTQNALTASDGVLYAARPTSDGCDGVHGARETVAAYKASMAMLGAVDRLAEIGIVVSDYRDHITPKDQTTAVEELRETGLLLTPLVPSRSIVPKARLASAWVGNYAKGDPVAHAYTELAQTITERFSR